jgi:CheY-like chemotaxis protein
LQPTTVRVLAVDDFELFHQFVRSVLAENPELQIVGDASNGLEAVQKAVELKPDLILMDIGLPLLNGIESARQILKFVPESKIIFLSQESSAEVMQEAMGVGAAGSLLSRLKARPPLSGCVSCNPLKKFGWETWTRTRIARFRVWSPTNWTISQPLGGKKEIVAGSR